MKLSRIFILALALMLPLGSVGAESPVQSGDRIAIVGNTFADQLRIHGYLETLLIEHCNVSIRNLGWGGDMLTVRDRPTGFPTEESTLTAHKTDVIIACFGMGESFAGDEAIEDFKRDIKSFITSHAGKKYNGKTEVRLVLVSPIACEDLGELTPDLEKRNRDLHSYTNAMKEVASAERVPFVDLFEPSRYLMSESKQAKLTTNGVHLNNFGYWAISDAFFQGLANESREPWRLAIDAEKAQGSATGLQLSKLTSKEGILRFSVKETSPPSLPPPTDAELPLQLAARRDTLAVTQLKPGSYTLTIDDVEVATATREAWAEGVAIDSSPAHREAEAFRAAINDKNLQFTYSWKALNQVHIVGERRSSPSGRALPAEVVEFNELANRREEALRGMMKNKTRLWRLAPANS